MAQILVRNLDPGTVRQLKKRAARKGQSLQSEVKGILDREAKSATLDPDAARRLAARIRKLVGRPRPESTEIIRRAREQRGNPDRWK